METGKILDTETIEIDTKAFGTLLKYIGLAAFGIILVLIIIFSLLHLGFIAELGYALFAAVLLIGIGIVAERI